MRKVIRLIRGDSFLEVYETESDFLPYHGYCDGELVVAAPSDQIAVRSIIRYAKEKRKAQAR